MASELPTHWVYCMEQGDILISRMPGKREQKGQSAVARANVEASRLTMQHLVAPATSMEVDPKIDPWIKQDPWAQTQPVHKGVSSRQVAAIEASVEKRVMDAIKPHMYKADDDEDMPNVAAERRITELEQQVQTMQTNMQKFEANVTQFQQQQTTQNQQVHQQLNNVQKQVESQQQGFQNLLQQSMADQMEKIEALLTRRAEAVEPKRPKLGE